jgi:chlorite dismutase
VVEHRNYVKYTFLKVDPAWRRRSPDERAVDKGEFAAACREFAQDHYVRAYSLVGTRGDCDLMVRAIARALDPIHELHVLLNQSGLMRFAEVAYSYLAVTRSRPTRTSRGRARTRSTSSSTRCGRSGSGTGCPRRSGCG